jgi:hypothetical protein
MFAWCLADMPGIPRELIEHKLKIFPNAKPIKQSMYRYNLEKALSMGEEINCLLEAKHQGNKGGHMALTTGHGGKEGHQDLQDVHRLHGIE